MLIDTYADNWYDWLVKKAAELPTEQYFYLLIDGVFIPDFYRSIRKTLPHPDELVLLFDALPGTNDTTRAVSPFVVSFEPNEILAKRLTLCSGWPMISAIATTENLSQFTQRLSSWCIVDTDNQRFNLRYPDTRRLPGIFYALTPDHQAELVGAATEWHFIGRDGKWKTLPLSPTVRPTPLSVALNENEFAAMVGDSEADEIYLRLQYKGRQWNFPHSLLHDRIKDALDTATSAELDSTLLLDWCELCIDQLYVNSFVADSRCLEKWRSTLLATPLSV